MAELRYIVRVANTDLDGKKTVLYGLTKIYGIGNSFAHVVVQKARVNAKSRLGELNDADVEKLNKAVEDLQKNAPAWIMNRPHDPETGESSHLLSANLKFSKETDIRNMRRIKTYRGSRHSANLPSRGQRTKSNFRRNKGKALGVKKAKK